MNKRFILIILSIIFVISMPLAVSGFSLPSSVENSHFLAPSAICVSDEVIFVADNVNGTGFVHVIKNKTTSIEIGVLAKKIRYFENKLYVLCDEGIKVINLADNSISFILEESNISNFDIGIYDVTNTKVKMVYSVAENLYIYDMPSAEKVTKTQESTIVDIDLESNKLYVMYGTSVKSYDPDGNETVTTVKASTNLYYVASTQFLINITDTKSEINSTELIGVKLIDITFLDNSHFLVVDRNDNKIKKYKIENGAYVFDSFEIGTNKVDIEPTFNIATDALTNSENIKIAYSSGYPSNILFEASKVDGQYRLDYQTLTQDDKYLILEDCESYYLIFIAGKVGFIEKSNKIITVPCVAKSEQKMTVNPSTDIFKLPYLSQKFNSTKLNKSTVVNVITELPLKDNSNNWLFVSFTDNGNTLGYGFLLSNTLIPISAEVPTFSIAYSNPNIGSLVSVYLTDDINSAVVASLRSGTEVKVYNKGEKFCKIAVTIDGVEYNGYTESKYLITAGLTNSQALGVACTACAVVILVFYIIMVKRIKRLKRLEAKLIGETE